MNNSTPKTPVSILILTKNEEQDLPGCLKSVDWADDVHVYDSFSTDRTVEIAREAGATVTQRTFDNWSTHQNWGLRNINFRHKWVYYSDADERVTPELAERIRALTATDTPFAAFRIRRRDFLGDSWLKYSTPSPFNIRLFRPEKIRYERLTNPVSVVDGAIGDVNEHFNHYPFSKGFTHWFAKHNSYSSQEAQQIIINRRAGQSFSLVKAFFCRNSNERRFHQKELYYRLPLRPAFMFVLLYILRGGFLDGKAGLRFAILRSIYEYMIVLKTIELASQENSLGDSSQTTADPK